MSGTECLKRKLFLSLYIIILIFFTGLNASAQESVTDEEGITNDRGTAEESPSSLDDVSQVEREYEFLKEQMEAFQVNVENERKHYEDFIKFYLWVVFSLGAIASGIFYYFFDKTMKDSTKKIESLVLKRFNSLIRDKSTGLAESIQDLARREIREQGPLSKKIFIVSPVKEDEGNDLDYECKLIRKRGFKNLRCVKSPADIALSDCDLVIYDYWDANIFEGINDTIRAIRPQKIPLIIYTSSKITRVDTRRLEPFKLYTLANSPLTLLNWVYTILLIYKTEGDQDDS